MKQFRHLISVLFAAMITLCFSITAFADEINYDIDFTREEAYTAVMNTTPLQAKNLYGGDVSYYEALSQDDKEQLFDMVWNLTESGILYEDTGKNTTIHLNGFLDDYFSLVIGNFADADSNEEGLQNLRNEIQSINDEYFSEDSPEYEKVEIVEKTEPEETQLSKPDVTTAAITMEETQPPTTLYTTSAPWSEPKKSSHTALIVILCLLAVGAAAGIGYYVLQTKKTK